MNENLKVAIAKKCSLELKKVLLIDQKIKLDREKDGVTTYSLTNYNEIISAISPDRDIIKFKNNNLLKRMEKDLASNLLLTIDEIEEVVTLLEEGIIKYGLPEEKFTRNEITNILSYILEKDSFTPKKDKWKRIIEASLPLGLNPKLTIYYRYNEYFSLLDATRNYICSLDKNGNDKTSDIPHFRLASKLYYTKDLFFILLNDDRIELVYKVNDNYQSIFYKYNYSKKEIFQVKSFNKIFNELPLTKLELCSELDLTNYFEIITTYLNNEEVIKEMVNIAAKYWQTKIFKRQGELAYPIYINNLYFDYHELLPTYSKKQQDKFINELQPIITQKLLEEKELVLNLDTKYNNCLKELLDEYQIIPSPFSLSQTMKLDLESKEIVVTDRITNQQTTIYKQKEEGKVKQKRK